MLEALEDVPKFIRRNTRLAAKITTMRRQDIPEYPEVPLREVLVNAVAHADYSLTGMRIRVAIYADRMEIENPGMLPFGMTLDDLTRHRGLPGWRLSGARMGRARSSPAGRVPATSGSSSRS